MITRHCLLVGDLFNKSVPKATICKYILALLVLKRSNDLYSEAKMMWDAVDEDLFTPPYDVDAERKQNIVYRSGMIVPTASRWEHYTQLESGIGDALNTGFAELLQTNSQGPLSDSCRVLRHVDMSMIDFNSPLLGHPDERDRLWSEALSYISAFGLGNHALENTNTLSRAVDDLIESFVSQEPERYVIPEHVADLLIALSDIKSNIITVAPCGEGKILHKIIEQLAANPEMVSLGFDKQTMPIDAFESDPCLFFICCMRMFLQDHYRAEICPIPLIDYAFGNRDAKKYPYIGEHTHVIGSIPVEVQKRLESEQEYIEGSQASYGIPLNKRSEFSHLAALWKRTVSGGKCVVAVPPGVLYKQRSEGEIRKNMILDDIVEAVIQLPPKLYSANPQAYAILILRRVKTMERLNKILFIDASTMVIEGKPQNTLSPDMVSEIVELYQRYETVDGSSRVVDVDEVKTREYSLDISRYMQQIVDVMPTGRVMEDLQVLKENAGKRMHYIDEMIRSVEKLEVLRYGVT
jgi:type I restriction enzyme M protein